MGPIEALVAAREVGIAIIIVDNSVVLRAKDEPPPAIVQQLKRYKADIVHFLRPPNGEWGAEDWRARYDELAGAAEFERCVLRDAAEAFAFEVCVVEWMETHIAPSSISDACGHCGEPSTAVRPLLPFGTERHGHSWLHLSCWPDWFAARRTSAVKALLAMGLGEAPTAGHIPGS